MGTVRATTEEIFEDEDLTDTINPINEYYADDWDLYNYALETELEDR